MGTSELEQRVCQDRMSESQVLRELNRVDSTRKKYDAKEKLFADAGLFWATCGMLILFDVSCIIKGCTREQFGGWRVEGNRW